MALSPSLQRTLDQVKTGLCMLYGAEYFTEDEWIKLDGLIHKGRYVFTNGPPDSLLELMTFDEPGEAPIEPEELVLDTENLSPLISEDTSASFSPTNQHETSSASSPEVLADEAHSTEIPANETTTLKPTTGGLALGYTQAQLDEVKAFNAGLTKAGAKSRPKYPQVVDEDFYPSPAWSEHGDNGLPTAAEQELRINSWADEVDLVEPARVASPFIEPAKSATPPGEFPKLIEQFVQVHGRAPNVANDVYQPNNPEFRGPRSESRNSSVKNYKSNRVQRKLLATQGTVFLAYSSIAKKSHITIEVQSGDQIKYIKHVSGIMHTGLNLRTRQQGQFPETILEPSTQSQDSMLPEQRPVVQSLHGIGMGRGRGTTTSTVSHSLDKVEAMNAAEWDRESDVSRPTTASVAQAPIRPFGGLAGSRFAAVTNPESNPSRASQSFTQAELRKIIREELAQSPKVQAQVHHSQTVAPHAGALTKIIPKTNTCWFWKTKNDCRFTAEECRDLHADLPTGELTNLRGGKPTWGALADALPPQPPPATADDNASPNHPNIDFKLFSKTKTCYYWATDGKCSNTAEECRYLHEYTAAGVAPRPGGYARKKDFNWAKRIGPPGTDDADEQQPSPLQNTEQNSQKVGDYVTEEGWAISGDPEALIDSSWETADTNEEVIANPNAAIWGAVEGSSAWDVSGDKYKPPHIKALEERQRIQAVGW